MFKDRSTFDERVRTSWCGSPGRPDGRAPKRPLTRSSGSSCTTSDSGPPSHHHLPLTRLAAKRTPVRSKHPTSFVCPKLHPCCIIIKNIPLDCKEEHFRDAMSHMNLPEPMKFEYVRDTNEEFFGVATMDCRTAEERAVVEHELHELEFMGRRLVVERFIRETFDILAELDRRKKKKASGELEEHEESEKHDQLQEQPRPSTWARLRIPEEYQVPVTTHLRRVPKHSPRSDFAIAADTTAHGVQGSRLLELLPQESLQRHMTVQRWEQLYPWKRIHRICKAVSGFWTEDVGVITKLTRPDREWRFRDMHDKYTEKLVVVPQFKGKVLKSILSRTAKQAAAMQWK
ncbi:hypothetical protein F5Y01DRAFT_325478 [Xylaria sp. FL0043]|nr:hypothetical protein F5Y01DRAFT_325478 [Xylaria sp. FL0043]